jgi:hypothetical protein
MILRRRIKNLEKKVHPAGDFEREKASLMHWVECGLLPDIDVDETAEELVSTGISLSDIVREVLEEIDGLGRGKLPSEEED